MRVFASLLAVLVGCFCSLAWAGDTGWSYDDEIRYRSPDGQFQLNINNRVQMRYTVEDPEDERTERFFDVARYKLKLEGGLRDDWRYRVQAELADGSEASEQLLEDAYFVFARRRMAQLWVGQGKTAFGRQQRISTGDWQFMDASIATQRFAKGRDVGVALMGQNQDRTYRYSVGIYNGNGINKDAADSFNHMYIGHLVVEPFGEYDSVESYMDREAGKRLAIGIAALTQKEGTDQAEDERLTRGCFEIAFGAGPWNLAAEFFTESRDVVIGDPGDPFDEVDTDGWYFQGGYLFANRLEVVGRYGEILSDTPDSDETEAAIGLNYYLRDHRYKVHGEFRRLEFEAPVSGPGGETNRDREQVRLQLQMSF